MTFLLHSRFISIKSKYYRICFNYFHDHIRGRLEIHPQRESTTVWRFVLDSTRRHFEICIASLRNKISLCLVLQIIIILSWFLISSSKGWCKFLNTVCIILITHYSLHLYLKSAPVTTSLRFFFCFWPQALTSLFKLHYIDVALMDFIHQTKGG